MCSKTMFFTFLTIISSTILCFINTQQHFFTLPSPLEQTPLFERKTNNYTINAYAKPVSEKINIDNNQFTDETVTAKQHLLTVTRDIAVVWLSAYPTEADVGQNITIEVVVTNCENSLENFNLTLFYDSNTINVIPIVSLPPYSQKTITFKWNTTNVKPGAYTLTANVTILEGEINTENNNLTDGKITIKPIFTSSYWTITTSFLIGIAVLILLMILLCLRKNKEKKLPQHYYALVLLSYCKYSFQHFTLFYA